MVKRRETQADPSSGNVDRFIEDGTGMHISLADGDPMYTLGFIDGNEGKDPEPNASEQYMLGYKNGKIFAGLT